MGRPTSKKCKPGQQAHLSVVMDGELLIALDDEAERMTKKLRLPVTRTAILRIVLEDWIAAQKEGK